MHVLPEAITDAAGLMEFPLGGCFALFGLVLMVVLETASHSFFVSRALKQQMRVQQEAAKLGIAATAAATAAAAAPGHVHICHHGHHHAVTGTPAAAAVAVAMGNNVAVGAPVAAAPAGAAGSAAAGHHEHEHSHGHTCLNTHSTVDHVASAGECGSYINLTTIIADDCTHLHAPPRCCLFCQVQDL